MQIIPRGTNFAGELGTGLGQLAGSKLSQLLDQYHQKQERSQFAQGLEPILGKDTANFLSNLGPDERKNALQNIGSLMQLNEAPSSREQVSNLGALNDMQQISEQKTPGQSQAQQKSPQDRAKLLQDVFTSPQEKREREKLDIAKRQSQIKEQQFNLKETKQYVDTLKTKEKAAKEADLRLKRMETLVDKGNLPNATLWSTLTKLERAPYIGYVASPFTEAVKSWIRTGSPDIEEFEKLSTEFVKNAKQYFGSRITEKEVQMFMQTIPTLMTTNAGKKKVIENIRSLNELTEIEAKAARSIIKENGGVPPIDIEQQVQDKIGKKLDKVAKQFIER